MSPIWPHPKPKPEPPVPVPEPPVPAPDDGTLGITDYWKLWQHIKQIPIKKLFPAVTATSAVLFFAISGVLAWLVVLGAFIVNLFKLLTVKIWRLFQ
ncbi:hypothetical protein EBZ39_01870 [bacterium]|nr:hypothetical protein [bacterium]